MQNVRSVHLNELDDSFPRKGRSMPSLPLLEKLQELRKRVEDGLSSAPAESFWNVSWRNTVSKDHMYSSLTPASVVRRIMRPRLRLPSLPVSHGSFKNYATGKQGRGLRLG